MKYLFSFMLLVALVNFASCQNSGAGAQTTGAAATGAVQTMNAADFDQKLSATPGAQLVDVRTPGEYSGGHLNNALNININGDNFEAELGKLDKTKPVFVYCKAGGRSAAAAEKMKDLGFTQVYNLDGGIMKWEAAGKPLNGAPANATATGLTQDQFAKMVAANKYVLVDFNATWCGPCQKMAPILEQIAGDRKDKLTLMKVDVDANKSLTVQKKIEGIPYMELYQDGKLVWTHEGYIDGDDLLKETKL